MNNYSYTLPGLPNYGIAEGSIFQILRHESGIHDRAAASYSASHRKWCEH
jgi:hypothetical protein